MLLHCDTMTGFHRCTVNEASPTPQGVKVSKCVITWDDVEIPLCTGIIVCTLHYSWFASCPGQSSVMECTSWA